jgi:hypothetical protein
VIEPSGCSTALCWKATSAPDPHLKLLWFEPSVQMIAPVDRSTF